MASVTPVGSSVQSNLTPTGERIPALDGWRGIAILLVLVDHLQSFIKWRSFWPWSETGQHGVTVFFVLSGFLITSKLLQTPRGLKRFYMRRFFRLMPVAWAYILAICLLTKIPHISVLGCLFFFRNYTHLDWYTEHFWSLSMEEQFYLVWPCVLIVFGRRNARWIAISGALAVALWRYWHWAYFDHYPLAFHTQVRADALLVGCLAALIAPKIRIEAAATAIIVLLYCMLRFHRLPPLIENLAIAALILYSVQNPASLSSRVVAWRPLSWLGVVSYSIYVWQQVCFKPTRPYWSPLMIPVLALCSYYLLEKPCVRIGHRLTLHMAASSSPPENNNLLVV